MDSFLILRRVIFFQLVLSSTFVLVLGNEPPEGHPSYNHNNRRVESISSSDEEKLIKLYGKDNYGYHKDQFLQVANMPGAHQEPIKHNPPAISVNPDYLQEELEKLRLQQLSVQNQNLGQNERPELTKISQPMVNKMIRNLLVRLEMLETNPLAEPSTVVNAHCRVQGLWVSTVKGVAIHLEPHKNENMLHLKVIDFPQSRRREGDAEFQAPPFITSDWVGTAHLSTEAPTTISIILQEKLTDDGMGGRKAPKTAVFVGQCLVCNGLTAIQGTWTVFPENPICFKDPSKTPEVDLMYLL